MASSIDIGNSPRAQKSFLFFALHTELPASILVLMGSVSRTNGKSGLCESRYHIADSYDSAAVRIFLQDSHDRIANWAIIRSNSAHHAPIYQFRVAKCRTVQRSFLSESGRESTFTILGRALR